MLRFPKRVIIIVFFTNMCIALTMLNKPPTCQERRSYTKENTCKRFACFINGSNGWCLPSLYLQLVNRNGKQFVLRDQPWRQTSWMVLLIRDRLLVTVGVFLFFSLPISPLPTAPCGLRVSFLESPTCCSADGLHRHCCQKCYGVQLLPVSEDEVEILGPFPAPDSPWL